MLSPPLELVLDHALPEILRGPPQGTVMVGAWLVGYDTRYKKIRYTIVRRVGARDGVIVREGCVQLEEGT